MRRIFQKTKDMAQLSVFNFITLNGCYKGLNGDITWHRHGQDEQDYGLGMLQKGHRLLLGRTTYDMMAAYWPTEGAAAHSPQMAEGMNRAEKYVCSRSLKEAAWANTKIIHKNLGEAVRRLKEDGGPDITILGSGTIVSQLAEEGLIDRYEIMIDPVAIGDGTPLFKDIQCKLNLRLENCKAFDSGVVLLHYRKE